MRGPRLPLGHCDAVIVAALILIALSGCRKLGGAAAKVPTAQPPLIAVVGVTLRIPRVSALSPVYRSRVLPVQLRYPGGWKTHSFDGGSLVKFYPQGDDAQQAAAHVELRYLPSRQYVPRQHGTWATTDPVPIMIAGIQGQAYQDAHASVPLEEYYAEIPSHHGTLLFTATLGPDVNLVPVLQQILTTVKVQ